MLHSSANLNCYLLQCTMLPASPLSFPHALHPSWTLFPAVLLHLLSICVLYLLHNYLSPFHARLQALKSKDYVSIHSHILTLWSKCHLIVAQWISVACTCEAWYNTWSYPDSHLCFFWYWESNSGLYICQTIACTIELYPHPLPWLITLFSFQL